MIGLGDCGSELLLRFLDYSYIPYQIEVASIMVIKAPRGTIALFGTNTDSQCMGIRAFMMQHGLPANTQEDDGELD